MNEQDFKEFLAGYIYAMLWSTTGTDFNEVVYEDLLDFKLAPETFIKIKTICQGFYATNTIDCDAYGQTLGLEFAHLGYDLWLTSAGHGVGFWDRGLGGLGERLSKASKLYAKDCYLGDDNLVYLS
jgi:hypothetical protein